VSPVLVTAQSKLPLVLDRSNTGILGSNLAPGMAASSCCSVLCCPMQTEALRWADAPS